LAIQNEVSLEDHWRKIGEVVNVLVEGPSKTYLKTSKTDNRIPKAADQSPKTDGISNFGLRSSNFGFRVSSFQDDLPQLTGRTATDHIVVFEGNARLIGQTVQVKVKEATAFTLFGEVITSQRIHRGESDGPSTPCLITPLEMTASPRISLPVI